MRWSRQSPLLLFSSLAGYCIAQSPRATTSSISIAGPSWDGLPSCAKACVSRHYSLLSSKFTCTEDDCLCGSSQSTAANTAFYNCGYGCNGTADATNALSSFSSYCETRGGATAPTPTPTGSVEDEQDITALPAFSDLKSCAQNCVTHVYAGKAASLACPTTTRAGCLCATTTSLSQQILPVFDGLSTKTNTVTIVNSREVASAMSACILMCPNGSSLGEEAVGVFSLYCAKNLGRPLPSASGGASNDVARTTSGSAQPGSTIAATQPNNTGSSSSDNDSGAGGGLSSDGKVGLGVGLGVGVPSMIIAAAGVWVTVYFKRASRRRKEKRRQSQALIMEVDETGSMTTLPLRPQPSYQSQTSMQKDGYP